MAWLQEHLVLILAVALGVSESLALIPVVKSNSIFQLVVNVLKALVPKNDPNQLK